MSGAFVPPSATMSSRPSPFTSSMPTLAQQPSVLAGYGYTTAGAKLASARLRKTPTPLRPAAVMNGVTMSAMPSPLKSPTATLSPAPLANVVRARSTPPLMIRIRMRLSVEARVASRLKNRESSATVDAAKVHPLRAGTRLAFGLVNWPPVRPTRHGCVRAGRCSRKPRSMPGPARARRPLPASGRGKLAGPDAPRLN